MAYVVIDVEGNEALVILASRFYGAPQSVYAVLTTMQLAILLLKRKSNLNQD